MGVFSFGHWLLVLLVVVLVFGTRKLAHIGKDLGEAVRNFKEGMNAGKQPDFLEKATEKPITKPAQAEDMVAHQLNPVSNEIKLLDSDHLERNKDV